MAGGLSWSAMGLVGWRGGPGGHRRCFCRRCWGLVEAVVLVEEVVGETL